MYIFLQIFLISTIFGISWIYCSMKLISPIVHKKTWLISVIVFITIQTLANYLLFLTPLYEILHLYNHPILFAIISYSIQFGVITFILYRHYHNSWKILSSLGFTLFCINTFHTMISYIAVLFIIKYDIPLEENGHLAYTIYNCIIHIISALFGLILTQIFTRYELYTYMDIFFKSKRRTFITTIICVSCWNIHAAIFIFYPIIPISNDANIVLGFTFLAFITIALIVIIVMQNNKKKLELQNAIIHQRNFHIHEITSLQDELHTLKHDIQNLIASFLLEHKKTNTMQLQSIIEDVLEKAQTMEVVAANTELAPSSIHSSLTKKTIKAAIKTFVKSPVLLTLLLFGIIVSIVLPYILHEQAPSNLLPFIILIIIILCLFVVIFIFSLLTIAINLQNEQSQQTLLLSQQYYFETTTSAKHSIASMKEYYQTLLKHLSNPIDDKVIKEIEVFIDKPFSTIATKPSHYPFDLKALHNIKIPELKNLILIKCSQMMQWKIPFKLEVLFPFKRSIIANIDLVRSLGILLDNAIEESMDKEKAMISIILLDENDSIYININNVLEHPNMNVNEIYNYGYSSKGENRGVGLSNYKKIIRTYDNVTTRTKIYNHLFIQELTIQK